MTSESPARVAPPRVPRTTAVTLAPRRDRAWAWWLPVLAGLAAWLLTITSVRPGALGSWGLLPELPPAYWVGLATVVTSAVLLSQRAQLRHLLLVAHTAVLVLLLYAISPAVEQVPRYTYTYKHIGITQYIERYGSVDANIDIYHRWPGFFSLSALFSQLAGLPDPTSYAAWAEPFFATLDGLVVWCCVQAVTRSTRNAWLATLLFTTCNWIGQNYYSPQAFGYLLMLGVLLLVLVSLQGGSNRFGAWLERRIRGLFRVRVPSREEGPYTTTGLRWRVALLVLVFDAVLSASHQLTPYVLLLQLGGLMVAGYLRPWWLAIATGVVTVGYLIPNLDYVINTFGIFDAPDPLANATQKNVDGIPLLSGKVVLYVGAACFLSVFVIAVVGIARRARQGYVRGATVLAILAFASPGMLAGQSYGGEARLRVLLYALPWCCAAATWALSPTGVRRAGAAVVAPLLNAAWFVLCFMIVFYGREDQHMLTSDEIRAAALLSDPSKVATDSVIVKLAPNFPDRYGPLYFRAAGSYLDALSYDQFGQEHALLFPNEEDVDFVVGKIRGEEGDRNGYLVFSRGQDNWARDFQLYPPYALRAFEGEVARSGRFRLVFDAPTVRVYELVR